MADTQPTGVVVLMASDLNTLAAAAEVMIEEGLIDNKGGALTALTGAARRARSSLTLRLAAVDNDRLVNGKPVVCRLQPPA